MKRILVTFIVIMTTPISGMEPTNLASIFSIQNSLDRHCDDVQYSQELQSAVLACEKKPEDMNMLSLDHIILTEQESKVLGHFIQKGLLSVLGQPRTNIDSYCFTCWKEFANKGKLRNHKQKIHREKTYACMNQLNKVVCIETFLSSSELDEHRKEHPTFTCPLCNCQWTSYDELKTHCRLKHIRKNFFCSLCCPIKSFCFEPHLYEHLKEEHRFFKESKIIR